MNYDAEVEQSDVLDSEVHARLIKEIEQVARAANIPVQMVWTSMKGLCTDSEMAYVHDLRQHINSADKLGLIYQGHNPDPKRNIHKRMMAVTGACLRNRINAKVMTLNEVGTCLQEGTMPNPTVLLIPNFHTGDEKALPEWRIAMLLDMLYTRQAQNTQTFLYIRSWDKMAKAYKSTMADHLAQFERIAA